MEKKQSQLKKITNDMKNIIIKHINPIYPELLNVVFRDVSKNDKARVTIAGHIDDVRKIQPMIAQTYDIEGLNWRECDPEYACLYFCER